MKFWLVIVLFLPTIASARVFSYQEAKLAAYIRGSGGLSQVRQDPFGASSGGDVGVADDYQFEYGGELGFSYAFTEQVHMRLGAELIRHGPVSGTKGTNSSGTEYFSLDSSVVVFNPNLTLEYVYSTYGNLRFYALGGVGLADVTVDNKYTMTSSGSTALSVSDFTEKLHSSAYSAHAGIGLESLFTDNVTFSFEVDYRYLPITSLK
jgi:opacity protein-like surface antigen